MKLIKTSILAMAFLCLLVSCSKDEDLLVNEQDMTEVSADLVLEDQFGAEILAEINLYRESIGMADLKADTESKVQALDHSKYMATKHAISHDGFFQRSDYLKSKGAAEVSENVAFGYNTADQVVQAWLKSPSHKAALEGDFTHSGIAVVQTETGVSYFTQIFIKQ
ncbi:MAG: CAP domain-containing protein [Leeuwenhoekiella sp.]